MSVRTLFGPLCLLAPKDFKNVGVSVELCMNVPDEDDIKKNRFMRTKCVTFYNFQFVVEYSPQKNLQIIVFLGIDHSTCRGGGVLVFFFSEIFLQTTPEL